MIIALLLTLSGTLFAQPNHPQQLSAPLNLLYRLEETNQLLRKVEAEGNITIKTSNFGKNPSNASWVPNERTIYLNFAKQRTLGSLVCSITFELHNALSETQFDYYDQLAQEGRISKEDYIAGIEYIEYVNACNASWMLEKGIRRGIFPSDASWPIAPTFQQHFHIQKMAGHSALIGYMYDDLLNLR